MARAEVLEPSSSAVSVALTESWIKVEQPGLELVVTWDDAGVAGGGLTHFTMKLVPYHYNIFVNCFKIQSFCFYLRK